MMGKYQEVIEYQIQQIDSYFLNDITKTKDAAEELLRISNMINYDYGKAYGFTYLAYYYIYTQKGEVVNYTLQRAEELLDTSEVELLADIHIIRGIYYKNISNEYAAAKEFLDTIELAEKNNYEEGLSFAYLQLGLIYKSLGDQNKTNSYLKRALKEVKKTSSVRGRLIAKQCYRENILYFCEKRKLSQAKIYMKEMDSINESRYDFDVEVLHCIIKAMEDLPFVEDSKQFINEIRQYPKDKLFLFDSITYMAELLIKFRDKDLSTQCLEILNEELLKSKFNQNIKVIQLRIDYQEYFNVKLEENPYKEFYELIKSKLKTDNKVTSTNLKNEILVYELNEKSAIEKEKNYSLRKLANIDDLTEIYNRSYHDKFISKLEHNNTINRIGYVMIDLDHFKEFNDNYGHMKGDEILRDVSKVLLKNSQDNILICRYGGDEFVAICTNMYDEEIETFIKKIQTELAEKGLVHEYSPVEKKITISIGYDNQKVDQHFDITSLINRADKALYESKRQGRNTWMRFVEDIKGQ